MSVHFLEHRVGKRGTVAVEFVAGRGRIRLGDTEWSARLDDGATVPAEGAAVEVVATDGTVMVVRALD